MHPKKKLASPAPKSHLKQFKAITKESIKCLSWSRENKYIFFFEFRKWIKLSSERKALQDANQVVECGALRIFAYCRALWNVYTVEVGIVLGVFRVYSDGWLRNHCSRA